MITFSNPSLRVGEQLVYSVETPASKDISVLLKVNPKTRRFLSDFYRLQSKTQELMIDTETFKGKNLGELTETQLENIKIKSVEEPQELKEMYWSLKEELICLLDLQAEYEEGLFTTVDFDRIWLVTMQANGEIQNQNLPPQNIEKKTQEVNQ